MSTFSEQTSARTALVVNKDGTLKPVVVKPTVTPEQYYKLCGLKKPEEFGKLCEWYYSDFGVCDCGKVALYGKSTGRSNMLNKYPFPQRRMVEYSAKHKCDVLVVDPTEYKYYGNCLLVSETSELTEEDWDMFYVAICENRDLQTYTKEGYVKDGFVVDDDDDDDVDAAYVPVADEDCDDGGEDEAELSSRETEEENMDKYIESDVEENSELSEDEYVE